MRRWIWSALGTLALATVLLAACGPGDDADATSASIEVQAAASTAARVAEGSTGAAAVTPPAATGDAPAPVTLQQIGAGRTIIYVGSMLVVVEDVRAATRQAQTAIAGLGGLVHGQETTTRPSPRTVITFRVLPEDFHEAMRWLEALGELESQHVSSDDVTERVVDLESRIITAEASVERLRTFLRNTTDLEGVAQLESQLLLRETDLERLRGQLRTIQAQAALSTIILTLVEPTPDQPEAIVELVQTAYAGADDGLRCLADDELTVVEGEPITLCISVENTGNAPLVEIEIRDRGLGFDEANFVVLAGDLAGSLEPGGRLLGYFEGTARLNRWPDPRFSAVPVDEDGDPMRIPVDVESDVVDFRVLADDSVPTFVDGLRASWAAVQTIGRVAVLALGVAIPFLWVPPLLLGLIWLGRRISPRGRPGAPPPAGEGGTDEAPRETN